MRFSEAYKSIHSSVDILARNSLISYRGYINPITLSEILHIHIYFGENTALNKFPIFLLGLDMLGLPAEVKINRRFYFSSFSVHQAVLKGLCCDRLSFHLILFFVL